MLPRIGAFAKRLSDTVPARSRILEIGSGSGELAHALARAGYEVVAVDREQRSSFPVLVTDFHAYDPAGMQFDCVTAMLVLHHIEDLEKTLQKIRALLKPRGTIAIDDYGWERLDERAARAQWGPSWELDLRDWRADREQLHTAHAMVQALDRHFTRLFYQDHAYFQDGLGNDKLAFTYIGEPVL